MADDSFVAVGVEIKVYSTLMARETGWRPLNSVTVNSIEDLKFHVKEFTDPELTKGCNYFLAFFNVQTKERFRHLSDSKFDVDVAEKFLEDQCTKKEG